MASERQRHHHFNKVSVNPRAHKRAMALPAQRAWTLTLVGVNSKGVDTAVTQMTAVTRPDATLAVLEVE
jgi:hypothetical protein